MLFLQRLHVVLGGPHFFQGYPFFAHICSRLKKCVEKMVLFSCEFRTDWYTNIRQEWILKHRKSIKKGTPRSFEYRHVLRGYDLTLFLKYWVGSPIVFKVSTAIMLKMRFKLCQRTLVEYATSCKNSIFLKRGCGRPTYLMTRAV